MQLLKKNNIFHLPPFQSVTDTECRNTTASVTTCAYEHKEDMQWIPLRRTVK